MPNSFLGRDAGLRRIPLACLFALALLLFALITMPPSSRATREQDQASLTKAKRRRPAFVPGEVLVRYKSESVAKRQTRPAMVQSAVGRAMPIQVERFEGSEIVAGLRIARVAPEDTMAAIEALKKQPDVLYAEPNYILHTDRLSNDPFWNHLVGMSFINAPQAWDVTTGSSTIVVGVVDVGVDLNHSDLQANIWNNPVSGGGSIPGITGDIHGYNFVDNTGTIPAEYHGSHVAGTVGAVGNNGQGVVGVNWNVSLMSLRALEPFAGGSTSDIIRAYNYAKQMRDLWVSTGESQGANIRVLNNSYGGPGFSQASFDAINALNQSGILFVASAGNDGENTDIFHHYPSGYSAPNVISVVAMEGFSTLASFSNFGAQSTTLGAPGVNILSTAPQNTPNPFFTDANGYTYKKESGTSMATPHVTGAAALICAQYPGISIPQLKSVLILNGFFQSELIGKTFTGRPLDVGRSFQALAENDTTVPGTVINLHLNNQAGRSINLGWTASGDDGSNGQAALYLLTFTDATGAVIPLANVIPASAGDVQTLDIKLPYRHTSGVIGLREVDNVGNEGIPATVNVSVPVAEGDPYATTLSIPVGLSTGGTPLALDCDDCFEPNQALPFSFPFFGQSFSSVTVSSNGALYFPSHPAHDALSSTSELASFKMIAGLWDDIDLRKVSRADADVYVVQPSGNSVIFRWQGVPCNDNGSGCTGGAPINFEIELRSDGHILTRYGSGNTDIFPVVGVSGGEPEAYTIETHTSEQAPTNLTNAVQVIFIPRTIINPLENPYFFVSQQYRDFLAREPDLGGLGFWSNEITACGSSSDCIKSRRVGVSAAFFIELEFQATGSFVYRLYKGGLGRRPLLSEFTNDRSQVVANANLVANKQALTLSFVQRPEFIQKYLGKNTAAAFVDALIATTGVDLSNQRTALIDKYNTGTDVNHSRALALRDAIDATAFVTAEYNPSFVVMQYFGYLKRDPELDGFLFWLDILDNKVPGNFRGMVCAFLTSAEYQERFSSLVPRTDSECAGI